MKSALSAPQLQSEAAAIAYVEAKVWPNGPVCPKCGSMNRAGRLNGKSDRPGLWKCYACRKPFTVRMGTVFESSHAPLHVWLQVIYLMASSKKGFATRQIQRTLECSMKTAWVLGHRVRECMSELRVFLPEPMGEKAKPLKVMRPGSVAKPKIGLSGQFRQRWPWSPWSSAAAASPVSRSPASPRPTCIPSLPAMSTPIAASSLMSRTSTLAPAVGLPTIRL
jgi:transposase-like protein